MAFALLAPFFPELAPHPSAFLEHRPEARPFPLLHLDPWLILPVAFIVIFC